MVQTIENQTKKIFGEREIRVIALYIQRNRINNYRGFIRNHNKKRMKVRESRKRANAKFLVKKYL